jgi:2-oxoglutarate/2-oxoacid ferredoxin oxidoreductase subunit alpha
VDEFIKNHDRIYVVEMNHDGQMCQLLRMTFPQYAAHIKSIAHLDGLPLSARWITAQISNSEEQK